MKSDREMLQAFVDGETLIDTFGNEYKLSETGRIINSKFPYYLDVEIKQKTIKINEKS